jgi:hypothetical protein
LEAEIVESEVDKSKTDLRKELIPKWIKVFGWIFIVLGVVAPILFISSLIFGFSTSYMMFGLEYEGTAFSLMPLIICSIILVNGVCAYGLLFGKDWGLLACIIYGYIGLAITIGTMFFGSGFIIRLEPIAQIPYLIKLHKLRSCW